MDELTKEQEKLAAESASAAKRQAELNKPDAEKLRWFGDMLDDLQLPELSTDWGKAQLAEISEILNQAIDLTR